MNRLNRKPMRLFCSVYVGMSERGLVGAPAAQTGECGPNHIPLNICLPERRPHGPDCVTKVFMGRAVKGAVCPSVFLELIHHQNTFTNLLLTINLIKGCDNMTLLCLSLWS